MAHKYDTLVDLLRQAITELRHLGLGDSLAKGRVGEILLAHELGHTLVPGDKGPDGSDDAGKRYEYKVSDDDQYNFNFGQCRAPEAIDAYLAPKLGVYEGSYCALLKNGVPIKIVYVPMTTFAPVLIAHIKEVAAKDSLLQKNFGSIDAVARVNGAVWIKK
jgi:hypothetical protein